MKVAPDGDGRCISTRDGGGPRGRSVRCRAWFSILMRRGGAIKQERKITSMASLLHINCASLIRRRRSPALRRTVSSLALLAGSMSLTALASPALAQCVENPANVYNCSGAADTTQSLTGPTVTITTTPGFTVDTLSNGGGSTFVVNGVGTVGYSDQNGSRLAGGGAYFTSDNGDLIIFSNGEIDSDLGLQGLGLETLNGGDINVTWTGHIDNSSGDGVRAIGTGDIGLIVGSVTAQDHGIDAHQNGPGGLSITANGDIIAQNGRGVNVTAGPASTGDISLDLKGVAAGGRGVNVINDGTGGTFIRATGPISGVLGLRLTNEEGSGELFVDVRDVSGLDPAVFAVNSGVSDSFIRVRDLLSGATGLRLVNTETARDATVIVRNVNAGGDGVAVANSGLGATSVTVEGTVTAGGTGVSAYNGAGAQDISVWTQGAVQGGSSGVTVSQDGSGSVTVRTDGTVVGLGGNGVRVGADTLSTNVTVTTQEVVGRDMGIWIEHAGSGGVEVTAAGTVVGHEYSGVAVTTGPTSGYITLDLQGVSGDDFGINVDNAGLGGSVVRAAGPVVSNGTGIQVLNAAGSGEILIDVADVSGVDSAVLAVNNGASNTFIRTGNLLSEGTALTVQNGATSGGLSVITGNVQANGAGISIDNGGTGQTTVTSTGIVTAVQGDGVNVSNSQLGQSLTISVQTVMAGDNAIVASHTGTGLVSVNAAASVIGGGGDGVRVHAGAQSTGVMVTASAVTGGQNGIAVNNFGTGDTSITTTGWVTGDQQDGIAVNNGLDAGRVTIDAMHAVGSGNGVSVLNQGAQETSITVRGLAQGGTAGVNVSSLGGGLVHIENLGSIRADMAAPSERAVRASGGPITLDNVGTLIGTVDLWGDSALVFNTGVWNSSNGESLFSGADDRVVNASGGLVFAAGDALTAETTRWTGLERFDNDSNLWLIDNGAGDRLLTSADTVFLGGSTLGVDFGGVASDAFLTEGALDIQAGAQLALNQVGGLTLNHRYVVAEALQGLTGEFDFDDVFLTAFAGLRDGYTATEAYVEFAQLRALAEAGLTPNQKAAASGADSLPDGTPVKDALLLLPTDEIAQNAFDQLSGEIHATARTTTVEDSRLPRDAVLDRLSDADGSGAVWVRAFEGRGVSNGDYNAARAEREVRGLVAGVDRTLNETLTLGAAIGVLKSETEVDRRASTAEVESFHGLIYAGTNFGPWRVSGGLGYARTVTETGRDIAFPGFSDALTADYDGSVLQAFVEAGYRVPASGGHVEPFASLTALRVHSDAFVESGGPAALSGEAINEDALISTLGVRFETNPVGRFSVRGMTGWRRAWGDVSPVGRHAFEGGATFEVLGAARSEDAAVTRVEAEWRLSPRIGFGLAYDGVLGDEGVDHAITGAFKVVF
jgi:outer membrane autotransporter protein